MKKLKWPHKKAAEQSPWEKAQTEFLDEKKRRKKKSTHKPPRLEDEMPLLTALRQHKLLHRFAALFLGFALIAYIALYFATPVSKVSVVSVKGAGVIGDQPIISASMIHSGDDLWGTFFQNAKVEQKIKKQLPEVKNSKLSIHNFNDVQISVVKFKTIGLLSKNNQHYPILENGTILKKNQSYAIGKYPVYSGFKEGSILDKMIIAYSQLDKKIKNSISEVDSSGTKNNPYQIKLYMNDGNTVVANMLTFAEKMKYYAEYASQMKEKGVLDIEVGTFSSSYETVKKQQAESASSTAESSEETQ